MPQRSTLWNGFRKSLGAWENSDLSARWGNAKPKTIYVNVVPSAIGVDYVYQNNALIGANMVSASFDSAVYDVIILTSDSRPYGFAVGNNYTTDPYWRSTISVRFEQNTGTITFQVLFKGGSQNFENLSLKAVSYLSLK